MPRVTIKTLAAAVGVSPATVSNAYNRPDQLSAELRGRILATAAELGFSGPDAAGRTLRMGRAEAVGVLLTGRLSYAFSDPYAIEFLAGLSEVVEQRDTSIVLMPLSYADGEPVLSAVRQASIDAMTMLALPNDHPAAQVARSRGISLVTTDVDDGPDASWVAIDDHQAGALVGRHLAALGHTDVAVIAETNAPAGCEVTVLEPSAVTAQDYSARLTGLRESVPGRIVVASGGHNAVVSGRRAAQWLLSHQPRLTALVGLSDVLALGALEVVAEAGLTVPGDVSVCGFDDIPAAAQHGLTTVHQPIKQRGREVGRLLLDPAAQPRQVLLPIELVVRSSSGPARPARS